MKKLIFSLLALACATALGAQKLSKQIEAVVQQAVDAQYFSGTVLVAKDNKILYHDSFGYADEAKQIPNKRATRFNVASLSKTFTAVMIMQLVEQGKIALDVPIDAYLPEYGIPNGDKITIHHLLTHGSGLSNYMMHPDYENRLPQLTALDSLMPMVADMPLAFDHPGERAAYSNSGFIVLGKIIEKTTGLDYWTYLRQQLLKPLGMNRTRTESRYPVPIQPPSEAIPYYQFSPGRKVAAADGEWPAFSDGGTYTTAEDLYRFALALQQGKLLKAETHRLMLHPELPQPEADYAYGFEVDGLAWGEIYGHGGGGKAFSANMRIGDDGYIIIALANRQIWLKPMFVKLFALLHGEQPEPIRQTADLFLVKEIEKQGAEAVCAELNHFLESNGYPAPKSPSDLLRASDMLNRIELHADAVKLAETTAQLFPDDAYAWGTLGELYFQQKQMEKAAVYFQKALEIDPKDNFAKMRLEVLARENR